METYVTSVQFVGSGDAFGSGGRLQTCILVRDGDWRCLIDCGASSLIGLKRQAIDPASVDAIVISHLHGDHFGGLPFLLLDAQFNSRRSTPLQITGHRDLEPRLRATMDALFPGSQRALDLVDVAFVPVGPGVAHAFSGGSVEVFEVEHACGAPPYAVRVTTPSGAVVGYSGDTAWTDVLIDAADGTDLFVVEAYFYDKAVPWHLDYTTLARHRSRLRTRRLVLTHMSDDMLNHAGDLGVDAAHDGLTIHI